MTNNVLPFTVVGDVHGRLDTLQYAAAQTLRSGLTTMVQVGDYWCYEPRDLTKVDRLLSSMAKQRGLDPVDFQLWFCDGNHENFNILDPDAKLPVRLSDHVTYVPRGIAVGIHGYRVGFLGGAESIDKDLRLEGRDWWPTETMKARHVARALDMGPVDVLVTHDTTLGVFESLAQLSGHASSKAVCGLFERQAINEVLGAVRPKWLVHGHHHTWAVHKQGDTTVVSLAPDAYAGSIALLGEDGTVHPFESRYGGGADHLSTQPIELVG